MRWRARARQPKIWFAWYPVRTGYYGEGAWVWWTHVRCWWPWSWNACWYETLDEAKARCGPAALS